MNRPTRQVLIFAAILLSAVPAVAHHSYAMFDARKQMTLEGTVKAVQWNNPHCFIQVLVPHGADTEEWSIEMGSPLHLVRNGWKPGSLKAGDRIAVTLHPMLDGSRGGSYMSVIGPDGKAIGTSFQ